ncbi:MAG: acyltransferase [Solirubrobacterales bacterium]
MRFLHATDDNQRRKGASGRTGSGAAGDAPARIGALDGFRALALLGVVTVHLLGASGVFTRFEGTGTDVAIWTVFGNSIDVFFIISAFVLFLPVVRRGGAFGAKRPFWVGRAARLLPAFWLVLAIIVLLTAVKPPSPGYASPSLVELIANGATMQLPVQLLDQGFRIGFGINGPLWIISIVVTFYLVLPFIARSWNRHPWLWLAASAALTIAWKQTIDWAPGVFEAVSNGTPQFVREIAVDQFPAWAFSFGLGMTGAWAFVRARERWSTAELRRGAMIAAPFVLLAYLFTCWQFGRYSLTVPGNMTPEARMDTVLGLGQSTARAAAMGVIVLGPLWLQRPFGNRVTRKVSDLSYGVYLIHWVIVIYAVSYLDLPRDGTLPAFAAWMGLVLPLALVYSAISRRWFEVPARRWIERRLRRSPAAGSAGGAAVRT